MRDRACWKLPKNRRERSGHKQPKPVQPSETKHKHCTSVRNRSPNGTDGPPMELQQSFKPPPVSNSICCDDGRKISCRKDLGIPCWHNARSEAMWRPAPESLVYSTVKDLPTVLSTGLIALAAITAEMDNGALQCGKLCSALVGTVSTGVSGWTIRCGSDGSIS